MREVCPGFRYTKDDANFLNTLWQYIEDYDEKKGIALFGSIGIGKTTFFDALRLYYRTVGPYAREIKKLTAMQIAGFFSSQGEDVYSRFGLNCIEDIYIDDIGLEPQMSAHYGQKENVIQRVLLLQYEIRNRHKTHLSTNLSTKEFTDRYGRQVFDRIKEMCVVVELEGDSKR